MDVVKDDFSKSFGHLYGFRNFLAKP
jgi:hypothetical protein